MPALQPQAHEIFAREFVARGARRTYAPEAAEIAGFTAVNAGFMLLERPEVKALVKRELELRFGELEITAKKVFDEIGRIAFSDPADLFDKHGDLLPIHLMTPAQRAAIASMEFETNQRGRGDNATVITTVKVKLWDKPNMLKVLAQHFKIISDDKDGLNALAGELAQQLRAGRERAQNARRAPAAQVVESAVEEARIIAPTTPAAPATPQLAGDDDEGRIW